MKINQFTYVYYSLVITGNIKVMVCLQSEWILLLLMKKLQLLSLVMSLSPHSPGSSPKNIDSCPHRVCGQTWVLRHCYFVSEFACWSWHIEKWAAECSTTYKEIMTWDWYPLMIMIFRSYLIVQCLVIRVILLFKLVILQCDFCSDYSRQPLIFMLLCCFCFLVYVPFGYFVMCQT